MSQAFQVLFLALFILPAVFFVITLQNTLKAISPENRKMPFANVWLLFIPLFNFYWQFVVVNKIAESIAMECEKLQIPVKETKPTYNLGLSWNICYILFLIPITRLWMSIILMITWILYWIKVNQYKKLIIENQNSFLLDAEQNIFYGDRTS
ncbi:MAG TPA: hypothetical protein VIJ75_20610 [Hanamia sp.]